MRIFCSVLLFFLISAASAGGVKLAPGASLTDGVITFRNGSGYAEERESEKFQAGKGLTIFAAVKLNRYKPVTGSGFDENKNIVYQHDMVVGKAGSFVFGRRSDAWVDQLYVNFFDGKKWCVPLRKTVATPKYGKWALWAVTLQPFFIREEGRKYTVVTTYLNGETVYREEVDGNPAESSSPVRWGQGEGIRGDSWGLDGELAEFQIFDRVLADDEIIRLARQSKLVKVEAIGFTELTPELKKLLSSYTGGIPEASWLLERLRMAAENGFDQKRLISWITGKLTPALRAADGNEFFRQMTALDGDLLLLEKDGFYVLVFTGKGEGAFPVLGFWEKAGNREVFGKQSFAWYLEGVASKKKWSANSYGKYESRLTADGMLVQWDEIDGVKLEMELFWRKNRIEFTAQAENSNSAVRLENFRFPAVRLKEKPSLGTLVHPSQSGELYPAPVRGTLPGATWYPCGRMNMQFNAYYDDISGVYLSPEDPEARMRRCFIRARGNDLELAWDNPVAFARDFSGGNSIDRTPVAALEMFKGNWFDAAEVYKKFAFGKARWNRPRFRETPQWFMENTLWLSHWTFKASDLAAMPGIMKKMRDFYEMPIGVHWYRWNDPAKGAFPHAFAKDGIDKVNAKLLAMGVYTKSYIDNRLWAEVDGPNRLVDLEFQKYGRHYAVINADKTMNYERYSNVCRDVVMCPGIQAWLDKMTSVTDRVASYGFPAIYHDQVSAARPFACFNPDHGHLLNDPAAWGDGYWKMFEQIAELQKKYPQLCHDTEDAGEAHLPFFDGFLTWRWTSANQIPLFAAVYAGKTQFTGRSFDHTSVGDEASFIVKCAGQLVQGEQIGWFTYGMAIKSALRASFSKQTAHLRKALLSFYNGGEMLKPLAFVKAPAMQSTMWGIASPKPQKVTLPEILHGRFRRGTDGAEMIIWVNTADHQASAQAVLPEGDFKRCKIDGSVEALSGTPEITLAPYKFEVWTTASETECQEIAGKLEKISRYTAGSLFSGFGILTLHDGEYSDITFDTASGNGVSGKGGMVEISGDGKVTRQYKIKVLLQPEKRYRLTLQMKKSPDGKGFFSIANYDKARKLKIYASGGGNVKSDGQWHETSIEFTTDAGLHNCGIFLYNSKSAGTVAIDRISLVELK